MEIKTLLGFGGGTEEDNSKGADPPAPAKKRLMNLNHPTFRPAQSSCPESKRSFPNQVLNVAWMEE